MRILFINRMASMVRGGGETFDVEMARHLAALGCDITFLTNRPVFGKATLELAPFRTAHIRSPMLLRFPWDRVPGGWRVRVTEFKWFEWLAARWAWRHRQEFDIIQVCELPYFVSYFTSRIPAKRGARPHPRIPKLVMRLTAPDFHDPVDGLSKADAVIASGDTMQRVRAGLRSDCVDIPNGVDVERFVDTASEAHERSSVRQEWGGADDDVVIVHVARFQSVKNHALLIDAFKQVADDFPACRLLLLGSGPTRPSVERKVAEAGLAERVVFMGEVPYDRLPMILATADIAVMCSDYESFCFAVLEGMAAGLPQVVTRTNWVPRLIGAERKPPDQIQQAPGGIVTPVGKADAFADGLRRLLEAPELRRKMGAWNRAKAVREHGWSASAKKLETVYGEIREP